MKSEHFEKRFGVLAVKKGFITSDQLVEALAIQVAEDISTGDHDLIGKILLEQGIITTEQIDDILKDMSTGSKDMVMGLSDHASNMSSSD